MRIMSKVDTRRTFDRLTLFSAVFCSTRDYLDLGDDPLTEGDFDRMYEERANA